MSIYNRIRYTYDKYIKKFGIYTTDAYIQISNYILFLKTTNTYIN